MKHLTARSMVAACALAGHATALELSDLTGLIWSPWTSIAPRSQQYQISPAQCDLLKALPPKRVAIIGAGSAGASTAYYLNQFLGNCTNLQIDVYERNSYIGGRSTTVNVFDDTQQPVELGASIFVQANHNLVSAVKAFNLSTADDDKDSASSGPKMRGVAPPDLGVWDGSKFVFTMPADESLWKTIMKLLWKYGTSPVRTQLLTKSTVGKFLKMYEEPYFPWSSLTEVVAAVGLDPATSTPGSLYLQQNGIVPPFSTNLIQASTRVNYAQNLDQIHGLETMVCMATEGAMAVKGGNWQIFAEMLKHSGANVVLNSTVTKICEYDQGGSARFWVKARNNQIGATELAYDDVVIAAPYQYSDIQLQDVEARFPTKIDYVQLHVTLFATPYELSPDYFGLDPAPLAVLTTLPDNAQCAENTTTAAPFYSVSTLREVTNPRTHGTEFVYKIFSPQPVPDSLLVNLLLPQLAATHPNMTAEDALISWKYEKIWNSYPYLPPRIKFEEFVLGDGLWYTAGIESFISTMETSSLSGMNVAASMKNSWGYPYNMTATIATADEL